MTHSRPVRLPFLAVSAAAILLGGVAVATAGESASDLDTLMLGSFAKTGKDGASKPANAKQTMFSNNKPGAANSHAAPSSRASTSAAPAVTPIASEPSEGLLAAFGIAVPTSSAPRPVLARPLPAQRDGLFAALGTLRVEESVTPVVEAGVPLAAAPPAPRPAAVASAPQRAPIVSASAQAVKPIAAPVVRPKPDDFSETTGSIGLRANAQMPVAYGPAPMSDPDYRIDAGDKLRVVVFGQEGLTNTYAIDAGGGITMPLIGRVAARGLTPGGLAAHITSRLRKGYIREPSVAVEIESYRPFFILGEVAAPGQYPYVPNMSVEAAVAIAGGFSPRARRDSVILTHKADGGQLRAAVPLGTPLSPGDTITVSERWF